MRVDDPLAPENKAETLQELGRLRGSKGWDILLKMAETRKNNLVTKLINTEPTGLNDAFKDQYVKGEVAGLMWFMALPDLMIIANEDKDNG